MTWEEWKAEFHTADKDPEWMYCSGYECSSSCGVEVTYKRDLLKAFADELVKRMRENKTDRTAWDAPGHDLVVRWAYLTRTIDDMLHEAGVER